GSAISGDAGQGGAAQASPSAARLLLGDCARDEVDEAALRRLLHHVRPPVSRTRDHRDELCREILKLKLKSDILEMRDLESKGTEFSTVGMS
ncbi:hypothetical protein HPB47_027880, partial [Ixodes persulcatus]